MCKLKPLLEKWLDDADGTVSTKTTNTTHLNSLHHQELIGNNQHHHLHLNSLHHQ